MLSDSLPTRTLASVRRSHSRATIVCLAALGAILSCLSPGVVVSDVNTASVLEVQGDLFVDTRPSTRGVLQAGTRLWEFGVIPVWIDPVLNAESLDSVAHAITVWNSVAGITIVTVDSDTPPEFDHVHVQPGEGCASWVGRRGGAQELWVSPDCTVGSVIHEFGHVIGLEHEHTRSDRDAWITINLGSVREGREHNFDRAPDGSRLLGEYDYASIMHYGRDYFSVDGSPTIEPVFPNVIIGQRDSPSVGDIASVAQLYGTDLSLSASLFAATSQLIGTHELDVAVSNNGNNGAHGVEFDVLVPQDWRLAGTVESLDDWGCVVPSEGDTSAVTCRLDRLPAGARSAATFSLTPASADAVVQQLEQRMSVAPLQVSLRSRTDELDGIDNQRTVTRIEIVQGVENDSPAVADDGKVSPFEVGSDQNADSADSDALLEDASVSGDSAGGGGAIHPVWLLLVLLRRRYWLCTAPVASGTGAG